MRTNGEEFNHGQQRGWFCCCPLLCCILQSPIPSFGMKTLGWEGTVSGRVSAQHLTPMTHQGAPQAAVRVACTPSRFRGATKGVSVHSHRQSPAAAGQGKHVLVSPLSTAGFLSRAQAREDFVQPFYIILS